METKKVFLAITAFWLAFSAGLSAEEQADTVKQFNALDYSLQKRYRPANETFISDRFIDNTFISAQGGIFNLAAWGDTKYAFGPSATLGMGKWINEYNAVRLSLSWKNFARKRDIAEFNLAGIGVNHLFNISSYLGGYRRSRFFELSTVEGLMYTCSIMDGDVRHALGLNLGLNLNMRLSNAVDLYLEPAVTVHTDGIDHSGAMNWHHYDLEYGVAVGLSVNIDSGPRKVSPPRNRDPHTYLAFFVGPQMQNSELVVKELGIFNSIGPHFGITAGRWLNDYFALQASGFYSSDKWIRDIDGQLKDSRYIGLRVEGRFDPLMMIPGWKEKSGFSIPLLFGPEAGYMHKDDRSMKIDKMYLGLTAAFQLRYKILDFLSLYLEPRFSIVPYYLDFHTNYLDESGIRETYYDGLVNVNFGIEIDITSIRRMLEK